MILPVLAFYIIFKYIPMGGLVIAFKSYNFADGILGSPWVGWDNFKLLFTTSNTIQIIWNTFWLSFLNLVIGFPVPIVFALMINEITKKLVQEMDSDDCLFASFLLMGYRLGHRPYFVRYRQRLY